MANKQEHCIGCIYNTSKAKGGAGLICNGLIYAKCPEWIMNKWTDTHPNEIFSVRQARESMEAQKRQVTLHKSCAMRLTLACDKWANQCKPECHIATHYQIGLGINPLCKQAVDRHEYWASSDSKDVTCPECRKAGI